MYDPIVPKTRCEMGGLQNPLLGVVVNAVAVTATVRFLHAYPRTDAGRLVAHLG